MRVGRRRGCGINAIDKGHPRKFAAYGFVGWWNVFNISSFNGSKPITFVDLFGGGKDATQGTDANRATFSATGWNNRPSVDYGAGGTIGYGTPSVTVGVHTFIAVVQANATSGYVIVQSNDAAAGSVFSRPGNSSFVRRGATGSGKNAVTWADGVKRQIARTFDGTHAGHLLYVNGIAVATTDSLVADPGVTTVAGPLYLGTNQSNATSLRGLAAEWVAYSTPMVGPLSPLRRIFNRQRALWPMA